MDFQAPSTHYLGAPAPNGASAFHSTLDGSLGEIRSPDHRISRSPDPSSLFDVIAELFNHRVSENLFGDAFHLGPGGGLVQHAVERNLEELSLAHAVYAL